jgi:hypothetical protein
MRRRRRDRGLAVASKSAVGARFVITSEHIATFFYYIISNEVLYIHILRYQMR